MDLSQASLFSAVKTNCIIDVGTGVKITSMVHGTFQGLLFEGCTIGIDTTSGGNGMLNLIDSSASNTSTLVNAPATSTVQSSMVLENVIVDSSVGAVSSDPFSR
jgi:glucan 1,3-beta-glucosidase